MNFDPGAERQDLQPGSEPSRDLVDECMAPRGADIGQNARQDEGAVGDSYSFGRVQGPPTFVRPDVAVAVVADRQIDRSERSWGRVALVHEVIMATGCDKIRYSSGGSNEKAPRRKGAFSLWAGRTSPRLIQVSSRWLFLPGQKGLALFLWLRQSLKPLVRPPGRLRWPTVPRPQ